MKSWKQIKKWTVLLLLAAICLSVFSCTEHPANPQGDTETGSGSGDDSLTTDPGGDPLIPEVPASVAYTADSMVALQQIRGLRDGDMILLRGYYLVGDGGGGLFYWDADCTAKADGGTVVASASSITGRLIRACEADYRNVRWFGATGGGTTDDSGPIQAAIDSLPDTGGTVNVPGGSYLLHHTIQIGNGDGREGRSTKNGVRLIGNGGGFSSQGTQHPVSFVAGMPMDDVIRVDGAISDLEIRDMWINGYNLAKNGLVLTAVSGALVSEIVIQNVTETGLKVLGGSGNGTRNTFNRFEQLCVVCINDNTTSLYMDGIDANSDGTAMTVFNTCRFDVHDYKNCAAVRLGKVSGVDFYRCHFNTYSKESVSLVLDGNQNDGYPSNNLFVDCSIQTIRIEEGEPGYIGRNGFLGHGTYDGEKPPTHPMLWGITDAGVPFQLGN